MRHQDLEPSEALGSSIKGFWYRDMDFGDTVSVFEVLPDGHAEIIFHFGSGCGLLVGNKSEPLPSPYIVGLLDKPIYFQSVGRLQLIGIKCLPWAVCDLLGISTLKAGIQGLKHPIVLLQPQLKELLSAGKVDEALALTQNWFMNAGPSISPVSALNKAGQAMLKANGTLPLSSVAETAHVTLRTLERKFKASSGYTVKDVSGLIRFEQARDRLWENPDMNIVGLAHDLGYVDQSHLNREFKRYSGVTAAAFAKQFKNRDKHPDRNFVGNVLSSE